MSVFPTDRESFKINSVELFIVQCFRRGRGYELLAHVHRGFSTWCLVTADENVQIIGDLDFKLLLEGML